MTRTIPTLAVLMAATLFTAAAANAQAARAPQAFPPGPSVDATAYPPGPSADAYPPGPTGQATAQTTNVNVVNAPTVNVGNAVTVQEPAREPVHVQRILDLAVGYTLVKNQSYDVPSGKRLVLENVNVSCVAATAQLVSVGFYDTVNPYPIASFVPSVTPWNSGSASAQLYSVRLLVDNSLTLSAYRPAAVGSASCIVTLIGYLTPLS